MVLNMSARILSGSMEGLAEAGDVRLYPWNFQKRLLIKSQMEVVSLYTVTIIITEKIQFFLTVNNL